MSLKLPLHSCTRSVALMVCHYMSDDMPGHAASIVAQLRQIFDAVVVINSQRDGQPETVEEVTDGLIMCKLRNRGLDFGKWHRVLSVNDLTALPCLQRVLLVNDTCVPTSPNALVKVFASPAIDNLGDFWGVTDSVEIFHHVQSYFLVFQGGRAIRDLVDFFNELDEDVFNKDKMSIVTTCEIGLSIHMMRRHHNLGALFPTYRLAVLSGGSPFHQNAGVNPTLHRADLLYRLGCPLIKACMAHVMSK